MPLYEYECTQCHRRTEKIQKFSDPEITQCPHCGGLLERVLSAPAISFKGGGWYADLYSSSKGTKDSGDKKDSGEKKSEPGAPSTSSESAPAAGGKDSAPAPSAPAAPAPAPAASTSSGSEKK